MPEKTYLGYKLQWDADWEIVSEQAVTADNPNPTLVAGLHFLLKSEDFVNWNVTPLYSTDRRVSYMAYYSQDKVCVLSSTEGGGNLLYEAPLPVSFSFNPDLAFPEDWDRAAWISTACSFITFQPEKVLWVLLVLIDANKDLKDALGVLGAFPLDNPSSPQWLTFSIPEELWWMPTWVYFPFAPARRGVILRVQEILNREEPTPQGTGSKKWLFVKYSNGDLVLKTFLLPADALDVVFSPQRLISGFDTNEKVKVLSPYEGLRWEWDDSNETFTEISGSTTPLTLPPHPVGGYHDEFVIYALLPSYTYQSTQTGARYPVTTTNPVFAAFALLQTTGRPLQVTVLSDALRNLPTTNMNSTYPTWLQGDINEGIFCFPFESSLIPVSYVQGAVKKSLKVTPTITSSKQVMGIAPIASKSPVLASHALQAPRVGTAIALPDTDIYVPLWLPTVPLGAGQPLGTIVLTKWVRKTMPIIINPQVDISQSGEIVVRFTMPVTGTRKVKFAIENPPVGGLNWSYMGSSFIISDSIADRQGWEIRVDTNQWIPMQGVVSKPTPASPPFEVRVRVAPVYSPYIRVIMQEV